MEERKVNFFEKMKTAEHRGFEISMFAVSILMAVVVLISIVMLGIYWGKGSSNTVSDDGADDMATSSAVTVDNDEDSAVATQPPETAGGSISPWAAKMPRFWQLRRRFEGW